VVHVRKIENNTLTFIVSGKLWRNSLVMQDKETNSLWSHITGLCLEGKFEGTVLEQIPSVQTTWAQWQAMHPNSRVLKKSEEIKSSQYQKYFDDPERNGLFRTFWLEDRLPGKSLVYGITSGAHALAVTDAGFESGTSLKHELGGIKLIITKEEDGGVRAVREDGGQAVLVREAFWFAWSSFFPNTEVLEPHGP